MYLIQRFSNLLKTAIMMRITFKLFFAIFFLLTIAFFSCQTSENELIEEPVDENTALTAALRTSLQNIATLDGSFDNILDGASCVEVMLPITVIVDGIEIIVDDIEDFETIEVIFDEFEDDEDLLEILFPITIVLQDFSEVVIDSLEELESFTSLCDGENEIDDDIECIDIQYPISFSVFDAENSVSDTVIVNSDEALFLFLDDLIDDVIVSINFPITLIGSEGNTIVVNNPEELENVIDESIDDCDEDDDTDFNDDDDDDISEEEVNDTLLECVWMGILDESDDFTFFDLRFLENNVLEVRNTNLNTVTNGFWSISESDEDNIVVTITLTGEAGIFNGDWIIIEFEEDQIEFMDGNRTLILEQDCDDDSDNEEDLEMLNDSLMECVWIGIPNGSNNFNFYNLIFNENGLLEAENTNDETILNGSWETFFNNEDDFILNIDLPGDAAVFNGNWFVEEFEEDRIEFADGDNTLVLEQDCSGNNGGVDLDAFDENLMECEWIIIPNGSPNFEFYRFEFQENGVLFGEEINSGETLTGSWETMINDDGDIVLILEFPLGAIEGEWIVTEFTEDFIELADGGNTLVMEKEC